MTTYTAIADSEIDPDSPITTGLMTKLRDNPIALTEGASGAPLISFKAMDTIAVSAQGSTTNGSQGTDHVVTWTTEDLDTQSEFVHTTGIFTPTVAGKYEVLYTGLLGGTGINLKARITKNSSHYVDLSKTTGDNFVLFAVIDMNGSSDTIKCGIRSDTASSTVSISDSFLTIKALGV